MITAATGALLQSLVRLERVELGYRPDSVFVARLSLPSSSYRTSVDLSRFSNAMAHALGSTPGVTAAGATSVVPLANLLATVPFAAAHNAPAVRRDWPSANYRAVSPGYFEAIGARRVAGRTIAASDDPAAPPVAVVNRTLAQRYFPEGAIGRELLINDNDTGPRRLTVVGVVDDWREVDLDGPPRPDVFIAMSQIHPDAASLAIATQFWAVRLRRGAASFGPVFLRTLRAVDPSVASANLTELRAYVDRAIAPRRFSVALLATFTLISLLLTTLGVYGIAAYTVEQRRREIGLRMALGATPHSIVRLLLGRSVRLAAIGIAVGAIGAYVANSFMSKLMFGVSAGDPRLLAIVSALLMGTALVASWIPGRRAANVDTLRALSSE
jgi:putative ABC transport system permease protein